MSQHTSKTQQKTEYWQKHLKQWKQSGLTQNQYCDKNGINKHTLSYWKKKQSKPKPSLSLVPVKVLEEQAPASGSIPSGITLRTTGNHRIELLIDCEVPARVRDFVI